MYVNVLKALECSDVIIWFMLFSKFTSQEFVFVRCKFTQRKYKVCLMMGTMSVVMFNWPSK